MSSPYLSDTLSVRWIIDDTGNPVLFKFGSYGSHLLPVPARYAAKRDKTVVVKAMVNDNICVEIPITRKLLAAVDDWRSLLTPLAKNSAYQLLNQ